MSQETLRALEHLRQRLNTLAAQLGSLRQNLDSSELLPSWPSIQNSSNLLSQNLVSLQATLSSAEPLLKSAHAYPSTSFPGRIHEDLLGQLLRKKLQPGVEDWIEEGVRHSDTLPKDGEPGLHRADIDDLWNWAGPEANRVAREIGEEAFADVFTLTEQEEGIENVHTGLRRKFWESDDEDDADPAEGKPDKMEIDVRDTRPAAVARLQDIYGGAVAGPPVMTLEALLKYTVTGMLPNGVTI